MSAFSQQRFIPHLGVGGKFKPTPRGRSEKRHGTQSRRVECADGVKGGRFRALSANFDRAPELCVARLRITRKASQFWAACSTSQVWLRRARLDWSQCIGCSIANTRLEVREQLPQIAAQLSEQVVRCRSRFRECVWLQTERLLPDFGRIAHNGKP